ncbi:MAG: type III-B CRISPR module-associated protein Cmr5 [Bacillota bacterium]|jgi:CRISPR-associated protein Cmr5
MSKEKAKAKAKEKAAATRVGIENGRAAYAFQKINDYVQDNINNEKGLKEYRSYLKKLPAMIQVNGLGQTLAFCFAKGGQYQVIYGQLEEWIRQQQSTLIKQYDNKPAKKFVELVVMMDSRDYRIITNEVIAVLDWMRRFADGLIRPLVNEQEG